MTVQLEQGRVLSAADSSFSTEGPLATRHKLVGGDTGGSVFAFTGTIEGGILNPPHTHAREDEVTYIIEGLLTVELGEEIIEAAAGSVIWKPRGLRHAFWNAAAEPVRYFEATTPAGLEGFFEAIDRLAATGELRPEKVFELAPSYGIEFDMQHGMELLQRFNLRLPA